MSPARRRAIEADRAGTDADSLSATADNVASGRDTAADSRGRASAARDRAAVARDHAAEQREDASGQAGPEYAEAVRQAAEVRAQAADDRRFAAADRDRATLDREEAGIDRERAANDRAHAAIDRRHAVADRHAARAELERAHIDDLTGAYRRGAGEIAVGHELDRAGRSGERLVLAFVDVDGLKATNDCLGHAAGDARLRDVVAVMRSRLRSYEPIVRYGGDEFVCTVSGAGMASVRTRFDEVNAILGEREQPHAVSVGLAEMRTDDSVSDLIDRADRAWSTSGAAPAGTEPRGAVARSGTRRRTGYCPGGCVRCKFAYSWARGARSPGVAFRRHPRSFY